MPTTMATSVQVLSKRKPYLKPHVQLEPRGFLEGFFEGVPHGVPRLQELGPKAEQKDPFVKGVILLPLT